MDDRPTALELLQATADFLEKDLLPAIAERQRRYEILIAVSALRITERELSGEDQRLRAELLALGHVMGLPPAPPPEDLAALRRSVLEANRELCDRIRDGLADHGPWRDQVLRHLETAVEDKLRISNPRELEALRTEAGEATP